MKKIFVQLIACGAILAVGGTTGGIIYGTWDKPDDIGGSGEIDEPVTNEDTFKIDGGYRFEFEEAEISGKSQNSSGSPLKDHMCISDSLEFSTNFSNGFAMKNISAFTEPVSFTFEFTSSKAETATVNLSVASKYSKTNGWSALNLSTSYQIQVNGFDVILGDAVIPAATATDVTGPTNFFAMKTVSFTISLVEGDNRIVFNSKQVAQNVDYFDIMTTSELTYSPVRTLGKGDQLISVIETPTTEKTGMLSVGCAHQGCTSGKDVTLPKLTDSFYKAGTGENEGKYLVTLFGKTFVF